MDEKSQNVLMGFVARFERVSTGSGITISTRDLRELIPEFPEDVVQLDGNTWYAVGLELFKDFELITWGDTV